MANTAAPSIDNRSTTEPVIRNPNRGRPPKQVWPREAPIVPAEFWLLPDMAVAVAARDWGQVVACYRCHPWHAQRVPQAVMARWLGLSQGQLSRVETGANSSDDITKLVTWANRLRMPADVRWFPGPDTDIESDTACAERALAASVQRVARLFITERRTAAWEITPVVEAQHRMVTDRWARGREERSRELLARLTGELDVLAGWVELGSGDYQAAQRRFVALRTSIGMCRRLRGYAWALLSYVCQAQADRLEALRVLTEADACLTGTDVAGVRAWVAGRTAEIAASVGDAETATRALERMRVLTEFADPATALVWAPEVTPLVMNAFTVTTYRHLRHPYLVAATRAAVAKAGPTATKAEALAHSAIAVAAHTIGDRQAAGSLAMQVRGFVQRTGFVLALEHLNPHATNSADRT